VRVGDVPVTTVAGRVVRPVGDTDVAAPVGRVVVARVVALVLVALRVVDGRLTGAFCVCVTRSPRAC